MEADISSWANAQETLLQGLTQYPSTEGLKSERPALGLEPDLGLGSSVLFQVLSVELQAHWVTSLSLRLPLIFFFNGVSVLPASQGVVIQCDDAGGRQ